MKSQYAPNVLYAMVTASLVASSGARKHSKHDKDKGDNLVDYHFPAPANFTGDYEICYYSLIRKSREEEDDFTGAYHYCPANSADPTADSFMNKKIYAIDDFNAYQVEYGGESSIPWMGQMNFTGFATRNSLETQRFGVGKEGSINHQSDYLHCHLFNKGLLECTHSFQEVCGGGDNEPEVCETAVGEWLLSYSIYSVSAKDVNDCPNPPEDYCNDVGEELREGVVEDETQQELPKSPRIFYCFRRRRRFLELSERNLDPSDHRRVISEHDNGLTAHVESDPDRLEWIRDHVAAQKERMEGGESTVWDPLIEQYFKNVHAKDIEVDCNSSEGSIQCKSSSKTQCGRDLIKGHSELHAEFASAIQNNEANPAFASRNVPDSCIMTSSP